MSELPTTPTCAPVASWNTELPAISNADELVEFTTAPQAVETVAFPSTASALLALAFMAKRHPPTLPYVELVWATAVALRVSLLCPAICIKKVGICLLTVAMMAVDWPEKAPVVGGLLIVTVVLFVPFV